MKIDPERVGRELSIALNNRVETCREGTRTPLQNSGKGVKGGRFDLDLVKIRTRYFLLSNSLDFFLFLNSV